MLHEFMSSHRGELLSTIYGDLRQSHPDWTEDQALGDIPSFIDWTIVALQCGEQFAAEDEGGERLAEHHGRIRRQQGVDLSGIVHDFGMICETVTARGANEGRSFDAHEFQILNRCLDRAIAQAIISYSNQDRSKEHAERIEHLGSLVHEIRNSLSSARTGFELIRKGVVATRGATADIVQRAFERITILLPSIIIESQQPSSPNRRLFAVAEFLGQVVAELFPERGIQIELAVEQGLQIDADPLLLDSAISNLLRNAIKFTRDREHILVRSFMTAGAVVFEVEDRCGGLPESWTELFEPFVHGATTRSGMGLGLTIARRAVEAHGGDITARNNPGIGCTFVVGIPAAGSGQK